jgi:glutamate racemase
MDKLPFSSNKTIGIFDSGVGGLSVLREIRKQIPDSPIIYFGDQIHVPYGPRDLEEVYSLSKVITQFLLGLGAGIIVVACNTASAAALYLLREEFPDIPFVGMEPAVKPAAEKTHTGRVGVLATPATFQGKLYNSVVERFAKNVKIYQNTCSGLVQEIEKGNFKGIETRKILENALYPMLENKIDSVVLGCTHYPFVIPLIKEIVGPEVTVIDPAPAVAKQTMRILSNVDDSGTDRNQNNTILLTSGSIKEFENFINLIEINNYEVHQVKWSHDRSEINILHGK